jgi:hypothetical protein
MDFVNTPLADCPQCVLDLFDTMIEELIKSIDGMPVRCSVYSGGIVVYLPKVLAHRPSAIAQVHKKTLIECLRALHALRLNEAGTVDTLEYKEESGLYNIIHDELSSFKHIEVVDRRCAICFAYTHHTIHKNNHSICNRCVLKIDKCPICREPIVEDDDDSVYSEDEINSRD